MTNIDDDNRQDFEGKLDRLIHLASESSMEPIDLPSDEAIEAYMFGNATEEQEQSVLDALEHSSAFRHEMLEIMDDLQQIVEKSESVAERSDFSSPGSKKLRPTSSLLHSIKNSFSIRLFIPAISIAAVALFFLLQPGQQVSSWKLVAKAVYPGELISIQLKGTSDQETISHYSTAKEAAFDAFQQLLILGTDGIVVDPEYENPNPANPDLTSHVVVLDDDNNILSHYEVILPVSQRDSNTSILGWLLLLPSRNLMQLRMTADSIQTTLPNNSDREGCLTITIQSDSGWTFTPPTSFSLSTNASN